MVQITSVNRILHLDISYTFYEYFFRVLNNRIPDIMKKMNKTMIMENITRFKGLICFCTYISLLSYVLPSITAPIIITVMAIGTIISNNASAILKRATRLSLTSLEYF